ncbi:hypothetical protein QX776_14305 [Alteromonadaceae bacterium BrNp21-10]|nr:hypothetical protein [Alteromonadaceae bacterium BrNp21-10]
MKTGKVIFNWNDDILYVEAIGPFNAAQIHEAVVNYQIVISHSPVRQFKVIECWDDEALGPPDGLEEVGQNWCVLLTRGCIAIAIVVNNELQKMVAEKFLPAIGKVFRDKSEALLWLKQQP